MRAQVDRMRVPFVANEGRLDPRVAYSVRTPGATFFVTQDGELVYALRGRGAADRSRALADGERRRSDARRHRSRAPKDGWSLTEVLVEGRARPAGRDRAVTTISDVRGNDRSRWRSGSSTYQAVELGEVWPGITVALHAQVGRVEKIFTVAPGASADPILVRVNGAYGLSLAADGRLIAHTGRGDVAFTAPVAFQERAGVREPVSVAYRLDGRQYGFTLGAYDRSLPLVIDPLLQSTFLGGDDIDIAYGIAIHHETGDVYVTGETASVDFPGTSGGEYPELTFDADAFVARLDPTLTVLRAAIYFGGSGRDVPFAIAIDPGSGNVYVAGQTDSTDLPETDFGAQPFFPGGDTDAFVALFPSDLLSLSVATYFGGDGDDDANGLALRSTDDEVSVFIVGTTTSTDLPTDGSSAQQELDAVAGVDAYVARLSGDLGTITRTTYLGGSNVDTGFALALTSNGTHVYVTGETSSIDFPEAADGAQDTLSDGGCGCAQDGYVARLTSDLTTNEQATYLGGTDVEEVNAIALHPMTGDVYVAGSTFSVDFPGTTGVQPLPGGGQDAYVARLAGSLQGAIVSTYLGGFDDDQAWALAIHPVTGDVYVTGDTLSPDFPFTAGGVQETLAVGCGCDPDMFIARLGANLASAQATYLGDTGFDAAYAIAISPLTGDVYVAGETAGPFPGTADGAQEVFGGSFSDGVVARLTRSLRALAPDLTIAKTHVGNFFRGQLGDYTITVTNVGTAPTDGTEVTVTDLLPGDLTLTGLAGSGWTCELAGQRCKRSDVLGPGASYPSITVTVSVPAGAASAVTNTATVSGGGDETVGNNTASNPTTIVSAPDLTVTKTHTGDFFQGQVGATFTITVENAGTAPTEGLTVTLIDTVPDGLTPTALGGTGWSCTLNTRTCTRPGPLGTGASFPSITLTVDVAFDASSALANTVTVFDGGLDANPDNNVASDVVNILVSQPDLTVTKTHAGNFSHGQVGATYTMTVSNVGAAPTDGSVVTVTDTVPAGLTPTALAGTDWNCVLATRVCTRSTVLNPGAAYPAITLTVDVAVNAPVLVTNTVTVAGGGDATPGNNTANDPTAIGVAPDLTIAKTHLGDFTRGQVDAAYTIVVSNVGSAPTAGPVTVTDTLPPALTATALAGAGWTCVLGTLTCTRADTLANGAGYSAITLTVTVAALAPGSVINTATVAGGGDATAANNTASDPTTIVFVDAPTGYPFYPWIEALVAAGITGGCSTTPPRYCPDDPVTRSQTAVFLLRAIHGGAYQPPPATGTVFVDVPVDHPLAAWIEQLAHEGITGGCSASPARYCPDATVTREQIAVLLLRAKHGAGYVPPPPTGLFTDVPVGDPFAAFIEQLAREGITGGCGPSTFCPDDEATRGQMAILLARAFDLPI